MHDYKKQVYQPEEDTYLLLEYALKDVMPNDTVLEVGTDSGFISGKICKISKDTIAVDINPHACKMAKEAGVEVIRCSLMSCLNKKFSLILFNPPYLPTAPEEKIDDWLEYALDGGITGRETIEQFAGMLAGFMSKTGRCLLLISSLTGVSETAQIFHSKGFLSYIIAEKKLDDETLYVMRIIFDMCRF